MAARANPFRPAAVLTALLLGGAAALAVACGAGASDPRTPAVERAERRLYDGAPPVVPHTDFGMTCTECHNERGMQVTDVGYAPPSPHEITAGMSATSRCRQCHVFRITDEIFVASGFVGLRQDLRSGGRLHPLAPPTMPHKAFMRENCVACHTGPAAREEIRTPHPERTRCRQCHLPVTTNELFVSTTRVGEGELP